MCGFFLGRNIGNLLVGVVVREGNLVLREWGGRGIYVLVYI